MCELEPDVTSSDGKWHRRTVSGNCEPVFAFVSLGGALEMSFQAEGLTSPVLARDTILVTIGTPHVCRARSPRQADTPEVQGQRVSLGLWSRAAAGAPVTTRAVCPVVV